ncbi:unnamed protein product, partial [marine sediment metagenome]
AILNHIEIVLRRKATAKGMLIVHQPNVSGALEK